MDHHYHPQDAVIETKQGVEEHLQVLLGTVAKLSSEFPVVVEIDPQHDRDAEDELWIGTG